MLLAQFVGTRAEGTINVSQAALNDLLNLDALALRGATLVVGADNQVVLRYGAFRVRATLPRAIETGPSPRVTVSLASFVVAIALRAALRQPYISVQGRQLAIALADVPALRPMRALWEHLRRAELATEPGIVRVGFLFAMTEATHA